jgi:uncharacterized cupredoxin-like copper-binding protein
MHRPASPATAIAGLLAFGLLAAISTACDTGSPVATPPITPGTSSAPRELNIVARDYAYAPAIVDLVPGETVVLHVVNGGLVTHEAILGDLDTQLAWEAAESPFADPPPGPTPVVPEPPGFNGVRAVVQSGQRLDVTWTVPVSASDDPGGWFIGCHIPGHWAKGMVVPIRFVDQAGNPLASTPPLPASPARS